MPSTLDQLPFEARFVSGLPGDPDTTNRPRQVHGAGFSRVSPRSVANPRLVAHSSEVAALLGLTEADCGSRAFLEACAGKRLLPGMDPFAMCYGGHQFGQWAGQLGDGRAINLGELRGSDGELWMLQLKGAGPTPYSRTADGFAVLRSSVREFLCSEAMHHLGVPTTRALSLVRTGESVVRDMFYDGHPKSEPGAVVCRVARSFLRFGSFELPAARGDVELLRRLADFTVKEHFPELGPPGPETYAAWLACVCRRTAQLVVHWLRVGFVHGVLNTDNMSILGETIDYGPYGWIDNFDPDWTPNTTDAGGKRYRFGAQPEIAHWNLVMLANALVPLVGETEPLQQALEAFQETYDREWSAMMAAKLGLSRFDDSRDRELVGELLELLALVETDMTIFHRLLADLDPREGADEEARLALLAPAYYVPTELTGEVRARTLRWLGDYAKRLRADDSTAAARRARMHAVNPKYVLRNYLAQMAIDRAEAGDDGLVSELLDVLRRPYDEQPGRERFAEKRPDWARHRPGCSMLSCSS